MAFCTNCGAQIDDSSRFCNSCGTKRDISDTQAKNESKLTDNNQGDANSKGPDALMVLQVSKKEGLIKQSICYIVFYQKGMVFAFLDSNKQKREIEILRQKLKAEGKGFLKISGEMMKFWATYGDKYYSMPVKEIVKEDKNNFSVSNSDVSKFVFTTMKNVETRYEDSTTSNQQLGKIVIEYKSQKLKFSHKYRDYNSNIKKVLSSLFGSNLKYRGQMGININLGKNKSRFS